MSLHESRENFLKIQLSSSESTFYIYKKKIKNALFNMFFHLLKDIQSNLLLECINIVIQYIQLIYFPFNSYVKINNLYIMNLV
jgi:hypothetical protein